MENNLQITTIRPVGRPGTIDEDATAKLVAALRNGLGVTTACQISSISTDAYYRKYNSDEEFRNKMEDAKEFGSVLASDIILQTLKAKKGKDKEQIETAKWWLERKKPDEFSKRVEVASPNEKPIAVLMADNPSVLRSIMEMYEIFVDSKKNAVEGEVVTDEGLDVS